ncbi:MAG TPA: hypothetical protein VKN18_13545 [Blastocatellia bacterium]|nr:hypothetical protein [Blastocatellia bacterium]
MHLRPLTPLLIILSLPLSQTTVGQVPAVRVRTSQLDRTPFTAGPLKITLSQFRASFLKIGGASVEVQVVNTADTFTSFSPQKLSFLGNDNNQVDVLAIQSGDHYWRAEDRRIAPGARTKEFYALNGKLQLPARLYYDEKLLAEIVE